MGWLFYLLAFLVALAITGSAVYALRWAMKTGQFHDLEKGATVIFDDEEPIGRVTDGFPVKRGNRKRRRPKEGQDVS